MSVSSKDRKLILQRIESQFTGDLRRARQAGRYYPGHEISGTALAERYTEHFKEYISDADMRKIINRRRAAGDPIGSNGDGYYYAVNRRELEKTIAGLKHRIKSIQDAIKGLESCYRGQDLFSQSQNRETDENDSTSHNQAEELRRGQAEVGNGDLDGD